jgi:CRP/FNR family transcriptional regulator
MSTSAGFTMREPPAACRSNGRLCDRCAGATKGLCHTIEEAEQTRLSEASTSVRLPARSAVFREGDLAAAVFTLVDGAATLLRLRPDGRQQIIGFRFAGDLIGYTSRDRYPCDAELTTEATVCRFSRTVLERMSLQCAPLSHRLLELCAEELAGAQDQLDAMAHRSAGGRVACFLLMLHGAGRRDLTAPNELALPMSRAAIGDFLGLTIESVSRVFASLRRAGLVQEPGKGRLLLTDIAALQAIGNADGSPMLRSAPAAAGEALLLAALDSVSAPPSVRRSAT